MQLMTMGRLANNVSNANPEPFHVQSPPEEQEYAQPLLQVVLNGIDRFKEKFKSSFCSTACLAIE